MSAARKLKQQPRTKIFHATMLVTRAEEWWVEAETSEEAASLLVSGKAHRNALGELIHFDLDVLHSHESEE
jgi:hypothetical protein